MSFPFQRSQPKFNSSAMASLSKSQEEVCYNQEKTIATDEGQDNSKKCKRTIALAAEILIDIFSSLNRNELDMIQLVNQTFNYLVQNKYAEKPIRVMYAVLLQEQDGIELDEEKRLSLTSAIINYSKGGNQRKRFDSVEQMLELKRQQKVHFSNVFIATKSATNTAVKERLHLAIIRDDPAKICNFFKYNEPVPAILPDIQPHILPNSSVYSRRPNFEMYHSRSFDCEWSHSIEPNDFLSVETFIQWIEFNNSHSHARPKRFRANIRGFTSRPDILLFFLFEHFQQQNQPCPFEIIVSQFSDQMHLITNFCNKSVRNYVTNEVLESICFTDIGEKPSLVSTEDLLNPDYRNVDWVLRRRPMGVSWDPWWSIDNQDVYKKFGRKQEYFSMETGHLMFKIRYSAC